MAYNEKIECHGDVSQGGTFNYGNPTWEKRAGDGTYGVDKRHCSYCGSLHPEDLVEVLNNGAVLELADRKYGWPHKFYVSGIANPLAGQIVKVGSRSEPILEDGFFRGKRKDEDIMGKASATLTVKFYNEHLLDLKGTPEFDLVSDAIARHSGIRFMFKEDGKLYCTRA